MAQNQAEYEQFLQVAIERLMVGTLPLPMGRWADANLTCTTVFQKAPCEKQILSHRQCVSGIKSM
jgi:hypothetical protein